MASNSRIKGTLKRTERPSKEEPEWKPTFSSNIVQTPEHYGSHTRQTTELQWETFPYSSESSPSPPILPQARSISQNGSSSLTIVPPRSASSAITAHLPSTNHELDHEDQPESPTLTTNQMTQLPPQNSERGGTAPWILASRKLHVPKNSMDFELITRLAGLRRQTDDSSTSSSPQASLAFLGSTASITSSAFSQSYSAASTPPAVEFPPTPFFADAIPAGFMRKLEPLSVRQIPNAPALKNSYPLQNSHTVIATRSLDTTYEVDSSSITLPSPNSTPRQQPIQLPAPTKSVPHYTPNPYNPPRQMQISAQITPPSNIAQQPGGLTSASTATPRTTKPLPPPPRPSYHSPPPMISPEHNPTPPPNKAKLKAWWNQFSLVKSPKGDPIEGPYRALDTADHLVFRKPLNESLRYASLRISTPNANGDLYVWGYIPIVIAKCGLYLKENATEVPGTFSISGSNRRMRDLQAAFENPPRYGKSLDWKKESYTTHDIASVFQRYLTQMPEPVIPYDMYHLFRDALTQEPFNREQVIATYKALIHRMPRANQYLLLYVLDLLMMFASKCDKNLMTVTNLAVIFCPGFISHPQHETSFTEHALSQKVLEFLIAQQDVFMSDSLPPTEP